MLRTLTPAPNKGPGTPGRRYAQSVVSDTTVQLLPPTHLHQQADDLFVNLAALLPPTSQRGQTAGTDGEQARRASNFLHQKITGRRMNAECQRQCFNKEGFEIQEIPSLSYCEDYLLHGLF